MIIVLLSLTAALILLDKYAFGEFGISQPLIAGTILGALFGNLEAGIFIGAMLQLIFLAGLPIGREIPPDGQSGGIIGVGSYLLLRASNAPGHALLAAVLFALIGALIGGQMEIVTRRFNEKMYRGFLRSQTCLARCHLLGILTAFIRGLAVVIPFFVISYLVTIPPSLPTLDRSLLMTISISIGFANGLYLFFKRSKIIYIIAGVLCGLVSVVL
jgi:mannose/fructose/N-acetylgalactosamine-specific phosphotransferase system component IIC